MKESKIWSVMDSNGKITRLVEAQTATQVRAHLLKDTQIDKPAALTVAKLVAAGMAVERAE